MLCTVDWQLKVECVKMLSKTTLLCACIAAQICSDDSQCSEASVTDKHQQRHGGNQSDFFFTRGLARILCINLRQHSIICDWQHARIKANWLAVATGSSKSCLLCERRLPATLTRQSSAEAGMSGGLLRTVRAECDSLRPKGWVKQTLQTASSSSVSCH